MFTEALSRFIARIKYEDLPQEAVQAAKGAVLDYLGVALVGSQEPVTKYVEELVKENRCCGEATVIGSGVKTSCSLAAWANGTMGHALDYDDCLHLSSMPLGHPSTVVLPAILGLSEKLKTSGKELLVAYCLGIETYAKVGLLMGDAANIKGWHNTAILGTMGATAGVSKLLRFDQSRIMRSFGIAASFANGLRRNFGTMVKPLHAGNAARNGVEAGLLVEKGLTSWETIFEAPLGYYGVFSGQDKIPQKTIKRLSRVLGNPWNVVSPGLAFKLYPSCRATHWGIDAALYLREEHSIDWRQISSVECYVPPHLESTLSYHEPQTGLEGKFSLEYCVARALIDGKIGIADFSKDRVNEPSVRLLMNKVKWCTSESENTGPLFAAQKFVVKLNDGTSYNRRVEFPKGEPQNPLSEEELIVKYENCGSCVLPQGKVSEIRDKVLNLEDMESVSQVTSVLSH